MGPLRKPLLAFGFHDSTWPPFLGTVVACRVITFCSRFGPGWVHYEGFEQSARFFKSDGCGGGVVLPHPRSGSRGDSRVRQRWRDTERRGRPTVLDRSAGKDRRAGPDAFVAAGTAEGNAGGD